MPPPLEKETPVLWIPTATKRLLEKIEQFLKSIVCLAVIDRGRPCFFALFFR